MWVIWYLVKLLWTEHAHSLCFSEFPIRIRFLFSNFSWGPGAGVLHFLFEIHWDLIWQVDIWFRKTYLPTTPKSFDRFPTHFLCWWLLNIWGYLYGNCKYRHPNLCLYWGKGQTQFNSIQYSEKQQYIVWNVQDQECFVEIKLYIRVIKNEHVIR